MHGTLEPLIEAEFAAMREKLKVGTAKASSNCAEYVEMLRKAAAAGFSISETGVKLSTPGKPLSRNAVMGVAHRAKPRVQFTCAPRGGGPNNLKHGLYAKMTKGTRKQQREASRNLSPRLSRVHPRERSDLGRLPFAPPLMYGSQIVFKASALTGAGTIAKRKKFVARCVWADCKNEPLELGKPYCTSHHIQSGARIACTAGGGVK